jgi:hypothetical protein
MDPEYLQIRDISHDRGDSGCGQRLRFHALAPQGGLAVLHGRIQAHGRRGSGEVRVAGRVLDGHNEQAALLASRVCFNHEPHEPVLFVNYGRSREPFPQRGVVRDADAHIKGDEAARITRSTDGQQPTRHLLAVSQACRHGFSVREAYRDALAGTLTDPC